MAAFRLIDKLRTFHGLTGQLLAGGYLEFYEAGTTTPADVYGDKALSVNNGSTVDLDASGRPDVDVWGDTDDSYKVELYDADDVKQGEIDDLEVPGGAGQTIPVPGPGEFLTGDGTNFIAASIREVPDPTGSADKILSTDGTDLQWVAKPADGAPGTSDVSDSADGFTVGNIRVQWGTGTASATGTDITTASITFPNAFSAAPYLVKATVTGGSTVNGHALVADSISSPTASGCTVNFNIADRHYTDPGLSNSIPFSWIAFGPK